MNRFNSDFEHGKRLARYSVTGAVIFCVAGLLMSANPLLQMILTLCSAACLVAVLVVMYKFCRCPHCGKRIMAGVLSVTTCPRCHRNLTTGQKVKKK